MVSDIAPQTMLFGIAIDLALFSVVYMRVRRGSDFPYLVALVLVLGLGAICGFLKVALYSVKVRPLLVVYELLLPLAFWLQLGRSMHNRYLIWAPLPLVLAVGGAALMHGWQFQSFELLVYELVFFLALIVISAGWTLGGTFLEGEGVYLIAGLAVMMVLGPGYGLIWSDMDLHFSLFAIVAGGAGASVVASKVLNPYIQFPITKGIGGRSVEVVDGLEWRLPPGVHVLPPGRSNDAMRAFMRDVRGGRFGLYISTEPVAKVLGRWGPYSKGGAMDPERPNLFAAQLTNAVFSENALVPSDGETLRRTLAEFLRRTGDGVVIIRDAHYLVSSTDIWETTEVLKFLRSRLGKKATLVIGGDLLTDWELDHLARTGIKTVDVKALGVGKG